MSKLWGKMSGFISAITGGGSAPSEQSSQMNIEELKDLVFDYRSHLVSAIWKGEDCTQLIRQLVELDCPLDEKYAALHVTNLLEWNNKNLQSLKHLTCGLSMIVKCAQHLIKAPAQRRSQWRVIHFNNVHIDKKVRPMMGFESVFQQLGYTQISETGMSFPEGAEPDKSIVVNLIADMMLFRKEMKEFIVGSHLHPEHINQFIPQETQDEVMAYQMSDMTCGEDDDKSEISQVSFIDMGPPTSTSQPFKASAANSGTTTSSSGSVGYETASSSSPASSVATSQAASNKQPSSAQGQHPIQHAERGGEMDALEEQIQAIQDLTVADAVPIVSTPLESSGGPLTSSTSTSTRCFSCDVCGEEAVVYCKDCQNKPLCDSCNVNWHKHPNRRLHSTDTIAALANLSMESMEQVHIDGAYGITAQTSQAPTRIGKKQQTKVVTTNAASLKKAMEDYSMSPQQKESTGAEGLKAQQEVFYTPDQARYQQMEQHRRDSEILDQQRRLAPQMSPQHQTQLTMSTGHPYGPVPPMSSMYNQMPMNSSTYAGLNGGFSPQIPQMSPNRPVGASMQNFSHGGAGFGQRQQQPMGSMAMMNSYYQQMPQPQPQVYQGQVYQPQNSQQPLPSYMQHQLDDHHRKAAAMGGQPHPPQAGWQPPYREMPNAGPQGMYVQPGHQGMVQQHQQHQQQHPMDDVAPTSYMGDPSGMYHTMPRSAHQTSESLYLANLNANQRPGLSGMQPSMVSPNQNVVRYPSMHMQQGSCHPQMQMPTNMQQSFYGAQRGPMASQMSTSGVNQMNVSGMYTYNTSQNYQQDIWPVQSMGNPSLHQSKFQEDNIDVRKMSQSSSASSSAANLRNLILEELQNIADPQERYRLCYKEIDALKFKIMGLDDDINSKMMDDEDFCETDEFKTLNKHKASMMKEKKMLEAYRKKMEEDTAALKLKTDDNVALRGSKQDQEGECAKIYYPPDIDISTKRVSSPVQASLAKMAAASSSVDADFNLGTKPKPIIGHEPVGASNFNNNNSGGASAAVLPKQAVTSSSHLVRPASSEGKPLNSTPVVSQGLAISHSDPHMNGSYPVASVNSASSNTDPKARVPVESSDEKYVNALVTPPNMHPPQLPPRPKYPAETSDLLNMTIPAPRLAPTQAARWWKCQHCTYDNHPSSHACEMCHKTSDNPQLVDPPYPDDIVDNEYMDEEDTEEEEVEGEGDSSFGNDNFINLLNQIQEEEQYSRDKGGTLTKGATLVIAGDVDSGEGEDEDEDEDDIEQTHVVAPRIVGSQEQVMLEKKMAQSAFEQQQQQQFQPQLQHQQLQQQHLEPSHSKQMQQPGLAPPKSASPTPASSSSGRNHGQSGTSGSQRMTSSSEYGTPPSRNSPSPPNATGTSSRSTSGHRQGSRSGSHTGSAESEGKGHSDGGTSSTHCSSLDETVARFNEEREIDTLYEQGSQLAKLIKEADIAGFEIEAALIAMNFCENQGITPVKWLQANWKKNIGKIITMATEMGRKQQQNCVGELSEKEAEEAYIGCHGNMKEAAQMCVDKRTALYEHLSGLSDFAREEILQTMFLCCGELEAAEKTLMADKLRPFIENIWACGNANSSSADRFALHNMSGSDLCHSVSTSVIAHYDFQKMIKDRKLDKERRIRMIFVEGRLKSWGRAELVIRILDENLSDGNVSLEDVVEAVRNCQDRQSALAYLQQECAICYTPFPMSKIRNLNICQCKMCEQCLTKNFEIAIREKHVRHWTCPLCELPDLNESENASDYLQFLGMLLQPLIDKELQDLYETKIRDWHLQKQDYFRWCAHCAEGFLADNQGGNLRMTCPYCGEKTCFSCKKEWEPQHEGLTCEEFAQWKIDNDPTNQSVGLAKHLDENGIDCPTCKMRFALAKGGCMHFKCPQCGFEFCSGCYEAYHQKGLCSKYKRCKNLGLHCHCPRDCFSFLRDYTVKELQSLLQQNQVHFNVETPSDQMDALHCPVMEQKEFDAVKRDEKCGKDTAQGQAGLCEVHYKEYLVYLINLHGLDPVTLMDKDAMSALLQRYDQEVPKQKKQSDEAYKADLTKLIKDKLPLRRR